MSEPSRSSVRRFSARENAVSGRFAGLTRGAWKHAGKKIPRTSQGQARAGKKVSKSKLRKGDLVFFYSGKSHVGIYAGRGRVIHASRPGKPVAYIKIKSMPYAGARRPA